MYATSANNIARTVLFVEDDPLVLRIYGNRLQREGFEVKSAENGSVAIEMFPQVRPDLVVLDLMLPKVPGLEVLKFIRADADLKATPVVVLSNVYMAELAHKAMQAGANKGMLKTECTPDKLVAIIRELLGSTTEGEGESQPAGSGAEELPAADAAAPQAEAASLEKMRAELLRDAPAEIAKIREHCVAYIKGISSEASQEHLGELYRRVRHLNARAGRSRCTRVTQLASALEAVIFGIVFKPSSATPSTLNTIAQAVDYLGRLFQNGETLSADATVKAKVLVVDDDAVCNYMTVAALKRANFDVARAEDPRVALQLLEAGCFDLVLLDINMPGLNGFEVCESLRRLPQYETVPVIFVTIQNDFQSRARSVVSGGDDFISKPISPLELVLKTTMLLQRSQEQRAAALPAEADVPAGELPPAPVRDTNDIPTDGVDPAASLDDIAATNEPPTDLPGEAVQASLSASATASPDDALAGNETQSAPTPAVPSATELGPNNLLGDSPQPVSATETTKPHSDDVVTAAPANPTQAGGDFSSAATAKPAGETPCTAQSQPPKHGSVELTLPLQATRPVTKAPAAGIATEGGPTRFETPKTSEAVRANASPRNHNLYERMKERNEHNQPFEQIVFEVARLMFGDDRLMDLNLRLTHIALEHYHIPETIGRLPHATTGGNGSEAGHKEPFEQIALNVTQILFGDDHLTDLNFRLVCIALEHYNVPEILKTAPGGEHAGQREAFGSGPSRATYPMAGDPSGSEQRADNDGCTVMQEAGSAV